MVVQDGATYRAAAQATGIPHATLEKRAARDKWQDQRKVTMSYSATARALKAALLERAEQAVRDDTMDANQVAQLIYAWTKAEQAYPEHRYQVAKEDPQAKVAIAADVINGFVEFLKKNDRAALAVLAPFLRDFAVHIEKTWAAA